jgi:hypothetical protein
MIQLSAAEAADFLTSKGVRNTGPHRMTKKIYHWLYCSRCGLLNLKNARTRRALKGLCVIYE